MLCVWNYVNMYTHYFVSKLMTTCCDALSICNSQRITHVHNISICPTKFPISGFTHAICMRGFGS